MLFTQKEGRKRALAALILCAAGGESMPAQSWSAPFNHNQPHAGNGVFTSPYSPWWSLTGSTAPSPTATFAGQFPPTPPGSFVPPNVTYQTSSGSLGHVFWPLPDRGWPQPEALYNFRSFNAVHMALIPKGPYRGHVLVWNKREVVGLVNPPMVPSLPPPPAGQFLVTQSYQAYAIIDPADDPLRGIRFRNFLVPMGDELVLPDDGPTIANNMFCAGHAWSPHGDLVIGGATAYVQVIPPPPDDPYIDYAGGKLVYVFNPRQPCEWPGTAIEYYPSSPSAQPAGSPSPDDYRGLWVRADDLVLRRWYPTATLTHRLVRESNHPDPQILPLTGNQSRMVFLGGSETVPALPGDRANYSYEAYVILGECDNQPPYRSKLVPDYVLPFHAVPFSASLSAQDVERVWNGPGVAPVLGSLGVDWLYEYPRTFLLSTGLLFFNGYAPRGAWVDHDVDPGTWQQADAQPGAPGTYSSNWQDIRHDGSAVLFPNLGGNPDVVLRLGGATDNSGATTDTMESIAAGSTTGTWTAAPSLPSEPSSIPDGGRLFANSVILPTGALLILGGQWQDGLGNEKPLYYPMLFEGGQWSKMPANPVVSRRTYHSTAVLLPDGRVFVGGGDDRDWDYEIFSPPYLNAPVVRPVNPQWQAPVPFVDPLLDAPEVHYGDRLEILCDPLPLGHAIAKAVLTAPCSVTHHSDMHQRYVELETVVQGGNRVCFYLPTDEREAPRGLYMLWLVTNTGTPSEAIWVVLR